VARLLARLVRRATRQLLQAPLPLYKMPSDFSPLPRTAYTSSLSTLLPYVIFFFNLFLSLLTQSLQTDTAVFTTPTLHTSNDATLGWPQDPFQPSSPSATNVRPDRPRLIAPSYKWEALSELIPKNPYLRAWNDTIFNNATAYYNLPPVEYFLDGSSGILDNCRYVKERVKAWAYVYRMTNDTKWVDRTVQELTVRIL
jgi:hypothetical protein